MKTVGVADMRCAWGRAWGGRFVAVAFLAAGMESPVAAEEQPTNTQFAVKLVDGSSIVCKPALTTIPLKTSFADIKLPLEKVEVIKFDPKTKTASFALLNGDKLQGEIGVEEMTVSSSVGELKIPFTLVREIVTMLRREPVYEDTPDRRNQCINNLRQIDAAKEQAALEHRWTNGTPVMNTDGRVNAYIKGNATPVCPAGGKYTYEAIGVNPKCSVPGHVLPEP